MPTASHFTFWEYTPREYLNYFEHAHQFLSDMRIPFPDDCRIETTIGNHDWLGVRSAGLHADNGTIICNVGGGSVARPLYRVIRYAHDPNPVGKYYKTLLHSLDQQEKA